MATMNPLNAILSLLAVVMYYSGDEGGCAIVLVMVVLSSSLTFIQEYRSSTAVKKLQQMINTTAIVSRLSHPKKQKEVISIDISNNIKDINDIPLDNTDNAKSHDLMKVPTRDLVPGDLILLKSGDMVPADIRLIEAKFLHINQSSMTGESLAVEKNCTCIFSDEQSLFDYQNLLFQGSSVVSGWAKGIIVKTGRSTIFGKLKKSLAKPKNRTPFDQGINSYVYMMLGFMFGLMILTLVANLLLKNTEWTDAIQFSLAVAVGLTPEMLPMIVTVNLAKGALEMSRKEVIVKKLTAIQNIGAMDVLCIDKTGTLTEDSISLEEGLGCTLEKSSYPIEIAYYISKFQEGSNNFLDLAIIEHVQGNNLSFAGKIKEFMKMDEIPFDFTRRCVSILVKEKSNQLILLTKGAVEEILQKSQFYVSTRFSNSDDQLIAIPDLIEPLTPAKKLEIQEKITSFNRKGYRILGVSYKLLQNNEKLSNFDENSLVLAGFLTFHDPPKSSSNEFIKKLRDYGLEIKVLTGDNPYVAQYICSQVGLNKESEEFVTGPELAILSNEDFSEVANKNSLFAKLTPEQKENIIKALQNQGRIVGFLGDGINDSLALKAADCSISVENAADIAKQCADIILLRKNLEVLALGVEEGRKTFGNIVKYLKMSASSSFGNVFSIAGASFLFTFLPITAVQLLIQTLLYDFSQCGIPFDNVDIEYIQKPRKWHIQDIAKFMVMIGPISSIFDYSTWGVMWYFFNNQGNSAYEITQFQTSWFIEGLMTQTLIVHIIRTHKLPFIESRASGVLITTTGIIMALAIVIPYTPIKEYVPFEAPPDGFYIFLVAFLIGYACLAHFGKMWFYKFNGLK